MLTNISIENWGTMWFQCKLNQILQIQSGDKYLPVKQFGSFNLLCSIYCLTIIIVVPDRFLNNTVI